MSASQIELENEFWIYNHSRFLIITASLISMSLCVVSTFDSLYLSYLKNIILFGIYQFQLASAEACIAIACDDNNIDTY